MRRLAGSLPDGQGGAVVIRIERFKVMRSRLATGYGPAWKYYYDVYGSNGRPLIVGADLLSWARRIAKQAAKGSSPAANRRGLEDGMTSKVYYDTEGRLALELSRKAGVSQCILFSANGVASHYAKIEDTAKFRSAMGFSPEHAAALLVGYAMDTGGSAEALKALGTLAQTRKEAVEKALSRAKSRTEAKPTPVPTTLKKIVNKRF